MHNLIYIGQRSLNTLEVLPKNSMVATQPIAAFDSKPFVSLEVVQKLVLILQKIEDPRLRDHKEPDKYTEVGCIMHMAAEALALLPADVRAELEKVK